MAKERVKKPIYKKWWAWVIVAVVGAGIFGGSDEEEVAEPVTNEPIQEDQAEVEEEKEPKLTISELDITSPEFAEAVKEFNNDIDKVDILSEGGVSLTFKSDLTFWDETSLVKDIANDGVKLMEEVFKNPKVEAVSINVPTTMVDDKGNESIEDVISVEWDRELQSEINHDNFNDMVLVDFPKFYNVSSSYSIHPGIFNNIKSEHLEKFENGFSHVK